MPLTASLISVRAAYAALALGTVVLGLIVHFHGSALGPTTRDMLGDSLWASMIFWWVGAIAPAGSLVARGVAAATVCFAVELSQLYHTQALDTLRQTMVGQLTLGSGFDRRDLLAYVIGVMAAALIERMGRLWLHRVE